LLLAQILLLPDARIEVIFKAIYPVSVGLVYLCCPRGVACSILAFLSSFPLSLSEYPNFSAFSSRAVILSLT
jgi:hypothetical protein